MIENDAEKQEADICQGEMILFDLDQKRTYQPILHSGGYDEGGCRGWMGGTQ